MPYLKKADAKPLQDGLSKITPLLPGELNYCFCQLSMTYLNAQGLSYKTLNDVIGALECAKLEITRRIVAPYETGKARDNGDVFKDFIRNYNIPTLF